MTAIAVTVGAIGFAVGIGLQKIGSNPVSGIMLLYRKPIRQGDVIAFEKSSAGVQWGWITDIGLMYVKDAVMMAVWDNFHANGIIIAFPQRDLHIKSAVPLKISGP